MRIGIIGTENSHVDHIIDYLNVERQAGDTRVVALSGGRSERNEKLKTIGGLERLVDEPTDLLGLVDAVIITDRHGGLHREHAVPFLTAGLPVFVDKPLACSEADARAIVAAAREYEAPLTSSSAVRWVPDTDALARDAATLGTTQVVTTTGPADPGSEYGGIYFYGIHSVDVALRLMPGEVGAIQVERIADTITATATVGAARIVVNLVVPGEGGQVPFHGMVVGRHGIAARKLTLGPSYVEPGLRAFLEMAETRRPPISYDDLVRPMRILDAIVSAVGP
ncbi:Gfo/Idh/MocA family oxidoreductase [Kribbella sp. CA-293567]|uniref:Gfo/Idh/MocA family oxidoreductase n=1 Tax=Kribbella sp. CA-293567 TaxID=3002436 RepID=UPI0022DE2F2F|nr:Gfo/Idh/MocA family oxidoreductase [Kribbella sp. CA-293567]WBQ03450.1 Gfo/Idh/MocA family oxidoreductase [Kribbella sp. CA-293567]